LCLLHDLQGRPWSVTSDGHDLTFRRYGSKVWFRLSLSEIFRSFIEPALASRLQSASGMLAGNRAGIVRSSSAQRGDQLPEGTPDSHPAKPAFA
jgi:hypothetical protein